MVLVLLPGGSFSMGAVPELPAGARGKAPNVDAQAAADERPIQQVDLGPFFLSKFEMTQGQWLRFTGRNPSYWVPGKAPGGRPITLLHPVEQVSWEDCRKTLRRLGLVLPTEAQWEYACRAGTTTPWFTGDRPRSLAGFANLADEGSRRFFSLEVRYEKGLRDGHVGHAPVGVFKPNRFGLHDTHGNVWEWCRDGYAPYAEHAPMPGDGYRNVPAARYRVYRGGGFYDSSYLLRSSVRGHDTPAYRDLNLGVRPARRIEE
jgi:formylglycine-generating enzyme required for sulfatase activity